MKVDTEIQTEKLRGEIAALIIDRDAQASRAQLITEQLEQARDDAQAWRNRCEQLEAENRELRKMADTPWWRPLLTGPTS